MQHKQGGDGVESQNAAIRATNISEVMEIILEFADRTSLVSCSTVRRSWSEQALDHLWSELPSLFPLLEVLGTLQYTDETGWMLASDITADALSRFYSYTIRVRSLTHEYGQNYKQGLSRVCTSVILRVFTTNPPYLPPNHNGQIFPRLRSLRWLAEKESTPAQLLSFLSPNVKTLGLQLPYRMPTETQALLQSLSSRDLPGLEELSIKEDAYSIDATICAVLVKCNQLKSLSLTTSYYFDPVHMRDIEGLPNLRYLHIYDGIYFEDKGSTAQVFRNLVEGCPHLEHLLAGMNHPPASHLGLDDIRPLLRLTGIKTLILEGNLPIVLQANDVAEMGQSWRCIKSLSLCAWIPWRIGSPRTSLEVLASFGDAFPPTLQKLGLLFKVPTEDVLRRSYPRGVGLKNLQTLSTGKTCRNGDTLDVGRFLGRLLPNEVSLLSGRHYYPDGLDVFPEVATMPGDDAAWWSEVRAAMRLVET